MNTGKGSSVSTLPRRKRNRLPSEVYRQGGTYFLTASVRGRHPVFSDSRVGDCCLHVLKEVAREQGVEVTTYCFMPDHVHLLITALEGVDAAAFMYRFKQASGFACNKLLGRQGPFWQASYYDHVVRKDEDIEAVREYVLENPVRAGLVENPEDYPYSGSLVIERED